MKKIIFALSFIVFVISLKAQNPPIVKNDTVSICLGKTDTISVLKNDFDLNGDSIFIKMILINASNGSLGLSNNKFIYHPNPGFKGNDFVYFQVCDNSVFNQCSYEVLILKVDTCIVIPPVNHAPVATNDVITICDSSSAVMFPIGNDTDSDNDSIYILKFLDTPLYGTDSFSKGNFYYKNNGTAGVENIRYVICDAPAILPVRCDTGLIVINVKNCDTTATANRAPTAQLDVVIAIEDGGSLPFNPTSNDTDPDGDPLTWTPVFGPLQGTIVQSGNQWRYFGNLNVNGADAMPYQVCDNGNPKLCAFSVVTFVISPVNDPPVAKNDSLITVPDNTTTPIPVLQNDSDLDGDPLNIKRVFSPSHGKTEIISNEIYYTPDKDYLGLDGFRYQICDSSNACSTANVYLNVVFVNDAPIAIDDSIKINDVQTSVLADVLKNDYDLEGDTFTISNVTAGTLATATIIEKDGKQYLQIEKISKTDCGMDLLTYAICGLGGCSTANVKVKVVCPFGGNLPQGFSPNGDGVNDKLVISNLDDFQPVQLIVYNRWGHPVFESQEYLNDWDGKAQSINQPLPDGTYFYTIRLNDDRKYNNFLEIRR